MAQDLLTLYNQALSTIGINDRVSDPVEDSPEASACNLWYETSRDMVLRAAHWPAAKAAARLGLLRERSSDYAGDWSADDPPPSITAGWKYAHAAPLDMLYPRQLVPIGYHFTQWTYSGHKAILTNTATPILEYTRSEPDMALWDVALFSAVVSALAHQIAVELTAKRSFIDRARFQANALIMEARAQIANADGDAATPLPDWIDGRLNMRPISRIASEADPHYVFPLGPLIGGGSSVEGREWTAYPEGSR